MSASFDYFVISRKKLKMLVELLKTKQISIDEFLEYMNTDRWV